MSTQQLFMLCHGTSNPADWIPMEDKIATPLAEFLGVDKKLFFYDEKNMLHPHCYFDGLFYYPFSFTEVKAFKQLYGHMVAGFPVQFRKSIAEFQETKDNNEWEDLFNMVDKKVLFHVFVNEYKNIPDNQKWDAYKEAHIRAENGFDFIPKEMMDEMLKEKAMIAKGRRSRMAELKKKLKGEKKFTIYHGNNEQYDPKDEMSWSLSRKTANFFATRFNNPNPKIFEKTVTVANVLDYFNARNEDEIILKVK